MITFHPSPTGGEDYLDLHTPDGARFYLRRDEARTLAHAMLAATAKDVVCDDCGRRNGVHAVTCATPCGAVRLVPETELEKLRALLDAYAEEYLDPEGDCAHDHDDNRSKAAPKAFAALNEVLRYLTSMTGASHVVEGLPSQADNPIPAYARRVADELRARIAHELKQEVPRA
ncbi:hypothetical protein ORV05_04810 [Amycolatopsis cynarae]|uniref:Uncharacterized protein n=1 Tax=Amycolatopsis cynarae TaxID=2995223 RepID=A0ABY7B479_9PSEU|nr:hypothetical protein [Amycolatopsis sp. HUAS 11-8]WAL67112.1 hypothetical protein ORV05_04810 [Amycolatopsis sp. HUAS 11-8]